MKKFIDLIVSYKLFLFKILWFEFIYILLGYKGNSVNLRENDHATDTIPCPYFFLVKIFHLIKKENINSFVDLGCGNGRVIYFFKKKLNIQYTGIEVFNNSFIECKKTFKNDNNVSIINQDFLDSNFNFGNYDCYFINDPLKDLKDHNVLINSIKTAHNKSNLPAIVILVNVSKPKLTVFNNFKLLNKFTIGSRGFFIYKL